MLEKTLESPLDYKEIKPVNPKENQPWIFTGRTDDEAEAPILWPPDGKGWLTGKRPWCCGRLRAGEEGMTEDETAWWHHWFNGYEFTEAVKDSLVCCSPGCHKESDKTEQLNKANKSWDSLSNKINKVVLGYNWKYNINIMNGLMKEWMNDWINRKETFLWKNSK